MPVELLVFTVPLQYRPFKDAVAVRRYLDNARFCVASAMMLLYPTIYIPGNILNAYDVSKQSVLWTAFKKTIADHFISCTSLVKEAQGGYYLCQTRSCFAGLAIDGDDNFSRRIVGATGRKEVFLAECSRSGWINESRDEFLKRVLDFFVPSIILKYLSTKKMLMNIDMDLHQLFTQFVDLDPQGASKFHIPAALRDEPLDVNVRFSSGTGASTRRRLFKGQGQPQLEGAVPSWVQSAAGGGKMREQASQGASSLFQDTSALF